MSPLSVQPVTGCAGAGSNGDYSYIGSNNTISYYEDRPERVLGAGQYANRRICQRRGYPSAGWMAAELVAMGQQLGRTPVQNEYQLAQIEFGAGTLEAPIWGERPLTSMPTSDLPSRICVRLQWVRK